ncbi:MAG: 50S ribosomal protein L24 [Succinatimonas sp.]|nr:50S ribosomal protein L24 [Succinatimonas sp.]
MAAKIRTNDEVIVITGKDKGKTGKVTRVFPSEHKVLVEGINVKKKHQKANPNLNQAGGIVDIEAPVDISNVAIYNPDTKKADRVGFKIEDGKKVRVFKSNDKIISTPTK